MLNNKNPFYIYFYNNKIITSIPDLWSGDYRRLLNKLNLNEPVQLIREYNNPYDPWAISIVRYDKSVIGYLKKSIGRDLGPHFDTYGRPVDAFIWELKIDCIGIYFDISGLPEPVKLWAESHAFPPGHPFLDVLKWQYESNQKERDEFKNEPWYDKKRQQRASRFCFYYENKILKGIVESFDEEHIIVAKLKYDTTNQWVPDYDKAKIPKSDYKNKNGLSFPKIGDELKGIVKRLFGRVTYYPILSYTMYEILHKIKRSSENSSPIKGRLKECLENGAGYHVEVEGYFKAFLPKSKANFTFDSDDELPDNELEFYIIKFRLEENTKRAADIVLSCFPKKRARKNRNR